jgi:hypothetical protein
VVSDGLGADRLEGTWEEKSTRVGRKHSGYSGSDGWPQAEVGKPGRLGRKSIKVGKN